MTEHVVSAEILARIDECARRSAEAAPPLTDEQRHVIATMFRARPAHNSRGIPASSMSWPKSI